MCTRSGCSFFFVMRIVRSFSTCLRQCWEMRITKESRRYAVTGFVFARSFAMRMPACSNWYLRYAFA